MSRYVVLVAYRPPEWEQATPEARRSTVDAHQAFERYVDEHGQRLSSGALCDADTATTLGRGSADDRVVTDGPFVDLAEQTGGYYDVELPDLDTAIAAGRLLPPEYTIEIRPVTRIGGSEPA